MAVYSPFLRPLGIAAGVLGIFQALAWGVLALVGILAYADAIDIEDPQYVSDRFKHTLFHMYFNSTGNFTTMIGFEGITSSLGLTNLTQPTVMTPGTVVVWTSIYFATSVIWLVISGVLLYVSCASKSTSIIITGWAAFTAVVAVIDFAGTVTFGLDYDEIKYFMDELQKYNYWSPTDLLLPPIFMMIMCARGFILWIMNVGLVISLVVAAIRSKKKDSPLLRGHENYPRPLSTNIYYDDAVGAEQYALSRPDYTSQGRQNTAFQPDTHARDNRSPVVDNQQPIRRDNPRQNDVVNPVQPIIPRVGIPVTPRTPQPTPQPDYTPPMQRAKREPFMYGVPARPVLKNSNAQEHTYF